MNGMYVAFIVDAVLDKPKRLAEKGDADIVESIPIKCVRQ